MLIGIDIDDVLYRTSLMVKDEAPAILRSMGLPDKPDESVYHFRDRFKLTDEQYNEFEKKLPWLSLEYVSPAAVRAFKLLKRTNPEVEYCVVTWRPEQDALPILQLLREYFYLDIDKCYCLPETESKAEFCEKHGVGIMFDDCEHVIRSFNADMNSRPVLVSTCHVAHNKTFAKTYDTVLTEWDELHSIYEKLTVRKDNV